MAVGEGVEVLQAGAGVLGAQGRGELGQAVAEFAVADPGVVAAFDGGSGGGPGRVDPDQRGGHRGPDPRGGHGGQPGDDQGQSGGHGRGVGQLGAVQHRTHVAQGDRAGGEQVPDRAGRSGQRPRGGDVAPGGVIRAAPRDPDLRAELGIRAGRPRARSGVVGQRGRRPGLRPGQHPVREQDPQQPAPRAEPGRRDRDQHRRAARPGWRGQRGFEPGQHGVLPGPPRDHRGRMRRAGVEDHRLVRGAHDHQPTHPRAVPPPGPDLAEQPHLGDRPRIHPHDTNSTPVPPTVEDDIHRNPSSTKRIRTPDAMAAHLARAWRTGPGRTRTWWVPAGRLRLRNQI